jgi:hypothetical protein
MGAQRVVNSMLADMDRRGQSLVAPLLSKALNLEGMSSLSNDRDVTQVRIVQRK